jgi:hypothetical protein
MTDQRCLCVRSSKALRSVRFGVRSRKLRTYHSRFIPEGVAEVSLIFLRDTHVLPKLVGYKEHCRRDGNPIAILLQSISGVSAINPLVTFYDIHRGKREVLFFYFSRTPHETINTTLYSVLFSTVISMYVMMLVLPLIKALLLHLISYHLTLERPLLSRGIQIRFLGFFGKMYTCLYICINLYTLIIYIYITFV